MRFTLLSSFVALALVACGSSSEKDARAPGDPACDVDPLRDGCTPVTRPAFAGLGHEVELLRDADGVPHVYAADSRDAMYASGYAQAVDRLFQMDLSRRRALGRRAEVLGEAFVEGDRLARLMDIPRWGRTNEADLFRKDRGDWELLQAWTAGVNARIDEVLAGTAPLPAEFTDLGYTPEHWDVSDGASFGKLTLFGNANQLEYTILAQILQQYAPDLDRDAGLIIPLRDSYVLPPEERPDSPARAAHRAAGPRRALPADAGERVARWRHWLRELVPGASNNWAVDGAHTSNGRPLVAGDPHQPLVSPSLFWMHHLHASDGSLDVAGWSFVGGPTVSLGHNRDVAWTATTTYGDMMDLWDVEVTSAGARVGGVDVPLVERAEHIAVAGAPAVDLVVQEVPGYGVLLPDDLSPLPIGRQGRSLLFQWTGFGVTHEFEGFIAFDRAKSRADFEAAVDRIELGSFNFVSADASGISYRASPQIPDRGTPSADRLPYLLLDGDDPATFWTGAKLGLDRLPHSHGGTRGWLASANNDPFGFLADGSIVGDPYYYGVFFDPGVRSARIEHELERLVARGQVAVDDMTALQDDSYSVYADDYLPELAKAWATVNTDPLLAEYENRPDLDALVARLAGWNRRMERDSSEAVVFQGFLFFLADEVMRDDLSLFFDAIVEAESAYVFKWMSAAFSGRAPNPDGIFDEPRQVSIARALDRTAAWLAERFPDGSYVWGDVHGTVFQSLYGDRLASPWVPTDGTNGTVNRADALFFAPGGKPLDRFEANDGPIYRMVASFRDDGTPEAVFTMGRGVSGDPASPHWDDLHQDWVDTRPRRLRYERSEVEADPVERTTLTP